MELFYAHKIDSDRIYFDEEESHHCSKVMRHRAGDELMVTDGNGKLFRAKIISDDRKGIALEVLEIVKVEVLPYPTIHIAIAPLKSIDRFEWFLEKATEIGINEITPVICHRSGRDKIKPDRLHKMLVSAMKQSLRIWLPNLNEITSFKSFITAQPSSSRNRFICHCQSGDLPLLKKLYRPKENVLIIIGPEGDFTTEEINLAAESGFIPVSLGDARLRTETAGIVALHTVRLLND